jgi:hypothetical protein
MRHEPDGKASNMATVKDNNKPGLANDQFERERVEQPIERAAPCRTIHKPIDTRPVLLNARSDSTLQCYGRG